MSKEVELITKPEELMKWMAAHDVLIDLSTEDITLLLDYLEGHDYGLGTDKNDELIRIDLAPKEMEYDEYSVDDLIDQVCEWNYELLLDADAKRNAPKDMLDFTREQNRYEAYKEQESILDRMFEQTKYARHIETVANVIVNEVLERCGNDPEKIATAIKGEIKQFSMERVR